MEKRFETVIYCTEDESVVEVVDERLSQSNCIYEEHFELMEARSLKTKIVASRASACSGSFLS